MKVKESSLLKQLYFWSFIAFGAISPFAGIFYKKVLIDPSGNPDVLKIGVIFSFAPIAGLLANLLSGIIADKTRNAKYVISWLSTISAVSAVLVTISGSSYFMNKPLEVRFIVLFTTVVLYRFSMMPINPLLDSETMQFLNKSGKQEEYGKFRFWGTIGWAVVTPIVGLVLAITENYQSIFIIGSIGYIVLAYLSTKTTTEIPPKKEKIQWSIIYKDWKYLIFLIFILLVGIIDSATSMYMGYFFDDVMNTPLKIGIMFSVWTTFEIPVMHYSKTLIKKLGSTGLITLGLLLGSLKLFLFSLFTKETPFAFQLFAALIHGPAFAFLFLGGIDIVDKMSHKTLRATYMGTSSIARYTLSGIIGSYLGAILIDKFGGGEFMRISSYLYVILIPLYFIFVKKHIPNRKI